MKSDDCYSLSIDEIKKRTGMKSSELAEYLNIHPVTINKWRKKGKIPNKTKNNKYPNKVYNIANKLNKLLSNNQTSPVQSIISNKKSVIIETGIRKTPAGTYTSIKNINGKNKSKTFQTIEEAREFRNSKISINANKSIKKNSHSDIISMPISDNIFSQSSNDGFVTVIISNSEDKIVSILKKFMS